MRGKKHVDLGIAHWGRLEEVCEEVPRQPGIYFLGAPFNIRYPQGISRAFYIGSSMNLKNRLRKHAGKSVRGNTLVRCFLNSGEGLFAAYLVHETDDPNDIVALEAAAFYAFG